MPVIVCGSEEQYMGFLFIFLIFRSYLKFSLYGFKIQKGQSRDMAQWLKTLATNPNDNLLVLWNPQSGKRKATPLSQLLTSICVM